MHIMTYMCVVCIVNTYIYGYMFYWQQIYLVLSMVVEGGGFL